MTNWKYTDDSNRVVFRTLEDGRMESCLASVLSEGTVIEPADPLPAPVYTCSPWQIRKALNQAGKRQDIENVVAASADQTLKDGWSYATEFRSDDLFVLAMGAAIGLNASETAQFIQSASML